MRKVAAMILATGLAIRAQDSGPSPSDAKARYERPLLRIRGVQEVGVSGSGMDARLVVKVDSAETRDAVQTLIGDHLLGCRVSYVVEAEKTGDCSRCTCPCHVGKTTSVRKSDAPAEECDILREKKGLPRIRREVSCTLSTGSTNDLAKLQVLMDMGIPHWVSKEMGSGPKASSKLSIPCTEHGTHSGEFVSYGYLRHRASCPIGEAQLTEALIRKSGK
jgi:hypothetical protein